MGVWNEEERGARLDKRWGEAIDGSYVNCLLSIVADLAVTSYNKPIRPIPHAPRRGHPCFFPSLIPLPQLNNSSHHPTTMSILPPHKRQRRTATGVCGGYFDPRQSRDALTSLLNGVPIYKEVEKDEDVKRAKKKEKKEKEKKEREKEKKRVTGSVKALERTPLVAGPSVTASAAVSTTNKRPIAAPRPVPTTSSFWQARPTIHIASNHRSVSVTPPPMPSSPPDTPGPSLSSATSATSSKRPRTPDDDEDLHDRAHSPDSATPPPPPPPRPKKKRVAARKGWKGWVEGSPPPSEKLINLDLVPILTERKTRSGKSFDAIGVGKDGWV